jgi:hypothetical protein
MDLVLHAIGWKHFTTGELALMFGLAFGVFLVMAFLMDILMEHRSFGIIGNTTILMLGAIGGLVALAYFGYPPTRREYLPALFACGISSIVMLIGMAMTKRAY